MNWRVGVHRRDWARFVFDGEYRAAIERQVRQQRNAQGLPAVVVIGGRP